MTNMEIRLSWKVYSLLFVVIGISSILSLYAPIPNFFRVVSSLPAIGGLLGVLITIVKDNAAHERNLIVQQKNQDYMLGVTSHMANVTFDKHVEFCEAYMNKTTEGFMKLMSQGPTPDAAGIALGLKLLRLKYVTWIAHDVYKKLEIFEQALFDIGMLSPDRGEVLSKQEDVIMNEEARHLFDVIAGDKKALTCEEENIAISKVTEHLQDILGIKELFILCRKAILDALSRIKDS